MSTTRISVTDSGIRLTLVRMRSSSSTAVSRGRNDTSIGRSAAISAFTSSCDPRREAFGQRVELEVHARLERLHVAAGHRLAPLVPDHAAQHVHRGVRAHQLVPPLPVDDAVHRRADRRQRAVERVPHVVAVLAHVGDRDAVERAGVVRLAATGRVERGAVERDPRPVGIDRRHRRVELPQVRVAQVQQLRRHRRRRYRESMTVRHRAACDSRRLCGCAGPLHGERPIYESRVGARLVLADVEMPGGGAVRASRRAHAVRPAPNRPTVGSSVAGSREADAAVVARRRVRHTSLGRAIADGAASHCSARSGSTDARADRRRSRSGTGSAPTRPAAASQPARCTALTDVAAQPTRRSSGCSCTATKRTTRSAAIPRRLRQPTGSRGSPSRARRPHEIGVATHDELDGLSPAPQMARRWARDAGSARPSRQPTVDEQVAVTACPWPGRVPSADRAHARR